MIPLVLVTGFLGSGKTTFLRRIAQSSVGHDVVFLVNEFADLNIDATRVEGLGFEVFRVTGGSLFCECRVGDFLANLDRIAWHFAANGGRLRGVVIETSGIADPEVMAKLLAETGMAAHFAVARIIALVAPYRFEAFLRAYPNLGSQIRTADYVLLNKCDLASEEDLIAVEAKIRELKPTVEVRRTCFADAEIPLWEISPVARRETGQLAGCANPYASLTFTPGPGCTVDTLRGLCQNHGDRLLRVKGVLAEGARSFEVDFASGEFTANPLPTGPSAPHLVVIVGEADEEWAQEIFDAILSNYSVP